MNIILKFCGIFLIALQLQQPVCVGHFYIGLTSGVISLGQAVQMFINSFMDTPMESNGFILVATSSMLNYLHQGIEDIKDIINYNQNVMELLFKKQNLEENVNFIRHALTECRRIITYITQYPTQKEAVKDKVIKLDNEYDLKIKRSYADIQTILTRTEIMSALDAYFSTNLQVFEHVCNTGTSQLQLLEILMISLTDITSQFYVARYLLLDLTQKYGNRTGIDEEKLLFNGEVLAQYQDGIKKLKMRMKGASRDVYACDKRLHGDDARYENGYGYYVLIAFQNYIFNQNDALNSYQSCKKSSSCSDIKRMVGCHDGSVPCHGLRSCKNAVVNCETMTEHRNKPFYACVADNANSIARYSSVVSKERARNHFSCPKENTKTIVATVFHPSSTNKGSHSILYPEQITVCAICNCICPDTIYYISTDMVWHSRPNTVLTGIRFRMKDNTLYFQAQYGELLPGAKVDNTTLQWTDEPDHFDSKVQITWNGVRAFDLTKVVLPKDYAMVGLRFEVYTYERVRLRSVAQQFNFTTGKVLPNMIWNDISPEGSEEVDLSNLDVPTRSPAITKVKSNDRQFVKFTTTSQEKDGGQTTIPFIESLDVVSKIPVVMGGVGLVYKASKEGYGGFLALKLLTYNIEPHVEEPNEMPNIDIDSYISNMQNLS